MWIGVVDVKACKFPGARTIGAPAQWDHTLDGECGTIFVTDAIDVQSGHNFMYSVYKPTEADLAALQAGGVIRLGIMGRSHPVFQLGVLGPELTERCEIEPVWDMGPVIEGE